MIQKIPIQKIPIQKKPIQNNRGIHNGKTICNNHELIEGHFKEWRYYNPVIDKHLALKDTLVQDGKRRCRVEIAMDISAQEWQGDILRSYQKLGALVNEGLRIALQEPTPEKDKIIL